MRKTVLVVEDDFDTLNPMAELLRLRGYNVTTASDAEKALSVAHQRNPDLIITDIVLPGKSGLHFITGVRNSAALKSTPIIVISGCGPMALAEAKSAGANCCLEKPISIDQFWAAIQQVLGGEYKAAEAEIPESTGAARSVSATEIDTLVEELRQSSSRGEREDVLKRLKERILNIQTRITDYT